MPTFTAIALDRLLEPRGSRSPAPPPPPVNTGRAPPPPAAAAAAAAPEKKRFPLPHASPALYATPASTPLPDSPSSFPPSPYIVNHKRRGPRLLKTLSQSDVPRSQTPPPPAAVKIELERKPAENGKKDAVPVEGSGNRALAVEVSTENGGIREDFLDPDDAVSVTSIDGNESERFRKPPETPMGEFYDALDEICSEGTPMSSCRITEDDMRELRLSVLMEIERRKQAEEALESLKYQWQRVSQYLSLAGLVLPAPPNIAEETDGHTHVDPAEELYQQVVVERLVAASIRRGCSRAEVELEMEPIIESKNFEIARLFDRLQYYEAANREMSQRNQEAVEMARQDRHKRKRRQKWIWSGIGLTIITLGSAALAWSYLPSNPPLGHDNDSSTTE